MSKFNNHLKQKLIQLFPKIELSYERFLHKKVSNFDALIAIPKGPKCFFWIIKYNGMNISVFLILNNQREIKDAFYFYLDNKISTPLTNDVGTIFYGTLFYTNISKCFTIENIFYHCGKNITNLSWGEKLSTIELLLSNNLQKYCDPKVIIGLPIITDNIDYLKNGISNSFYNIYKIEYRKFNDINKSICTKLNQICENYTSQLTNDVFIVKPTLQNDIYELYDKYKVNKFIDIAHIPDYKTSVMMNSIFRKIKENENLDALEESDDEEEFQNDDEEQYVSLDTSYKMKCIFNHKFQKWQPVEIVTN